MNGGTQLSGKTRGRPMVGITVRVEQSPLALAATLGAVQGSLRCAEQDRRFPTAAPVLYDADATGHRQPAARDVHRLGEFGIDVGGEGGNVRCRGRVLDEDRELVVTDAWWQNRLDDAIQAARPRYIPELSIDVLTVAAIAALCGDPTWRAALVDQIVALQCRLADVRAAGDALVARLMEEKAAMKLVFAAMIRAAGRVREIPGLKGGRLLRGYLAWVRGRLAPVWVSWQRGV